MNYTYAEPSDVVIRDRTYTVYPPSEIVLLPFLRVLQSVDETDAAKMQDTVLGWFGDRNNHADIAYIVTQAVPDIDPTLCCFESRRFPDGSSTFKQILRLNVQEIMTIILACVPINENEIEKLRSRLEVHAQGGVTPPWVSQTAPTGAQ